MSLIKVTKKNGQFTIVPAGQRSTYESMNARNTKMKKLDDVVTIEDYEEPAEEVATDKVADKISKKATDKVADKIK